MGFIAMLCKILQCYVECLTTIDNEVGEGGKRTVTRFLSQG